MKQLTLTVPNSINDSLNAIETLRFHGTLTELACRLLEMLYIAGWEDGFVALDRPNISRALGASPEEVSALLRELEELHLACARTGGVSEVAEIIALSSPKVTRSRELSTLRRAYCFPAGLA